MAKKKTATKKPAAKKKPAETPLLKAAKRVIQEIQVGQIDPGCNAGEDALAELLGLCGCPCSHHEASLQVHMDQCQSQSTTIRKSSSRLRRTGSRSK